MVTAADVVWLAKIKTVRLTEVLKSDSAGIFWEMELLKTTSVHIWICLIPGRFVLVLGFSAMAMVSDLVESLS